MRAISPQDNIGRSVGVGAIPQPKVAVGTKLDLSKVVDYNQKYIIRRVRRDTIRRTRASLDSLHREGTLTYENGRKMRDCHKAKIREVFHFMETADSVVVAGVAPSSLTNDMIANQCYVDGSYSPLRFHYYLMFRKNVDGKELVYTYPKSLLGEGDVLNCVIREQPGAAA